MEPEKERMQREKQGPPRLPHGQLGRVGWAYLKGLEEDNLLL